MKSSQAICSKFTKNRKHQWARSIHLSHFYADMKMWSTNIVIMLIVTIVFDPDGTKCVKSIHNRPQVDLSLVYVKKNAAKENILYNFHIIIISSATLIIMWLRALHSSLFGIPCSYVVSEETGYIPLRTYIRIICVEDSIDERFCE